MLRATTACTFSTSQLPKAVRPWCVLYIFTWKCASRHNGVHFFDIATSKSGPTLRCFVHFDFEMCFAPQRRAIFHLSSGRRFSEPTFRPSGAPNHWKNTVFRDFPTFSRICIFFLLTLLSSNLSLLSASSLLCFSSVHIVGSLTSKLPSTTTTTTTLHYTPLHYNYNYTPLNYTTLHYIILHYTTLHCTTLHYLPLHFTTLHYTTLDYTTTTTTTTQLHSTTPHYTKLHYTTLHYTTFHYTPLHYVTLHYITLNDTAPQIDR